MNKEVQTKIFPHKKKLRKVVQSFSELFNLFQILSSLFHIYKFRFGMYYL